MTLKDNLSNRKWLASKLRAEIIGPDPAGAKLDIKCVKPEDIIGLKIQAYTNDRSRELQDKADIKALFELHSNMDINKVKEYAEMFGEWNSIKPLIGKQK